MSIGLERLRSTSDSAFWKQKNARFTWSLAEEGLGAEGDEPTAAPSGALGLSSFAGGEGEGDGSTVSGEAAMLSADPFDADGRTTEAERSLAECDSRKYKCMWLSPLRRE